MYFSKANKREVEKRYIRFDKHIQRLLFSGFLAEARLKFNLPSEGFSKVSDYKQWLDQIIENGRLKAWDKCVMHGLRIAKLPVEYLSNIEQMITLNFPGVYDTDQPGIIHHRTDKDYFRSKRITELYSQTDPVSKKKVTSEDVVEKYQIPDEIYNKLPQKKADKMIDNLEVGGPEVRKIASKFKKQIMK